ncbi:MAG: DUF4177 domain-containing protein [Kiritimatiellales bacterium]|jgi:hypothetical protein
MQTWEYKTIKVPFSGGWGSPILDWTMFDTVLNQLGSDGWELVSVFTSNLENGRSGEAIAVFKRARKE